MTLKRLGRKPATLGALNLFAALDASDAADLVNDPARIDAAMAMIRDGLEDALSTQSTVHGWRVQNLFAATVVALDGCVLLKEEDEGTAFYDGEKIKVPDWRVTLRDGRRLLVEVRGLPPSKLTNDFTMSAGEVTGLRRYGELTDTEVYVAIFWASFGLWALVPLDALTVNSVGRLAIGFEDAMKRSRMVDLGDRMLGLRPPLSLRLIPDATAENTVTESGEANFTIGAVELWCGGNQMETDEERKLVWFLLMTAPWDGDQHAELTSDETAVEWVSFDVAPESPAHPGQDFEIIAPLSRLYSRLYNMLTMGENGVTALTVDADPGQLVRLIPLNLESERLPLWHFLVEPAS
jgi:hypothetical protein